VRDVHDARVGGDVDDYGFADGDGVVGGAEIVMKMIVGCGAVAAALPFGLPTKFSA